MNYDHIEQQSFVDVPASPPEIKLPLQKVGISQRPHYIKIIDPFTMQKIFVFANVKIFFNLPAHQRGLHMSRIEKGLQNIDSWNHMPIKIYGEKLVQNLLELQGQRYCNLELWIKYEQFVAKNSSGRKSHEVFDLFFSLEKSPEKEIYKIGIKVPFINACPCAQRWAIREFYHHLRTLPLQEEEIHKILKTAPRQSHTNGGIATIIIQSPNIDYRDIYAIIQKSVPILRELLSGADEHEIVKEAHQQAMFCEDNTRTILKNTVTCLSNKIDPDTIVETEVEVNESVHFHNLVSRVEDTLGNMRKILDG